MDARSRRAIVGCPWSGPAASATLRALTPNEDPMTAYDDAAGEYDQLVVPRFQPIAERLLRAVEVRPDDQVLEVAAGTGGLSRLLVPRLGSGGRLVVTDLAPRMLDRAEAAIASAPRGRAGLPRLEVVVADLAALPFADASFDLVIGQMTPLLDTAVALVEAARVLRPGGRLAAATWGRRYEELGVLNTARASIGVDPYPVRDPRTIAPLVRGAGFTDVVQRTRPMTAVHADLDAYAAYRLGFGTGGLPSETVDRYLASLRAAAARFAGRDGRVRLGWSITIVTARRA